MVFFTCNACGTALKKNQVERHMGCSRNFSCMDCQKEFCGDEFKSHTKCISEAEKYNGPDWKAPSSQNKGERKQFAWVETCNSVLEKGRANMNPKQIALLNTITKHDNVPRKKAKFLNFVKNVTRNSFDGFTVDAVWDLLEAEWKRQAEANKPPQTNGKANGESKLTENGSNANGATNGKDREDGSGEENGDEKKNKKGKSKKNKRKREENGEEEQEVDVKKKKKGKSGEDASEEPENANVEGEESTGDFRWGEIIQQILTDRDDKSISLKKLKKKVFSEYYARVGDSKGVKTKEDLSALLNKKLKKKKFKVVGEIVKLTAVE